MNDLKEFYSETNGDLEDVIGRLKDEERVIKFVKLFLHDDTIKMLNESQKNSDYQTAFRAAHTLKGTSKEMGFLKLNKLSQDLTEELRSIQAEHINIENANDLLNKINCEYNVILKSFDKYFS